jgi:2-keto-3-deoxy-galactonokinase
MENYFPAYTHTPQTVQLTRTRRKLFSLHARTHAHTRAHTHIHTHLQGLALGFLLVALVRGSLVQTQVNRVPARPTLVD